jgi:hypothetical protein
MTGPSLADQFERLNPSVVRVVTVQRTGERQHLITGQLGTGFILTDDGYIATAGHNLGTLSKRVQFAVLLPPGQIIPCRLVASNIQWRMDERARMTADLGVLKTQGDHAPLTFAPIGDPLLVRQGEEVGVLGFQSLEDPRALGVMNLAPREAQDFLRSIHSNTFAVRCAVASRIELTHGDQQSSFLYLDRHLSAGMCGAPVLWPETGEVVGVVSSSKIEAQMSGIAQVLLPAEMTKCFGIQLLQRSVAQLREADSSPQPPEA